MSAEKLVQASAVIETLDRLGVTVDADGFRTYEGAQIVQAIDALPAVTQATQATCATCKHCRDDRPLFGHRTVCWHPLMGDANKCDCTMVPIPFGCTLHEAAPRADTGHA